MGRGRARSTATRSPAAVDHLAEGSAWLRCVAWWLEVAPEGGIRTFTPSTAAGALLARTIEAVGADAVAARFDWLAHEQSGFAAAKRRWVAEHDVQLSAFARQGRDAWLQEVDAAALAWVAAGRPLPIARNSPSRASGGRTPPQGPNPGERALLGVLGALGRGRRETVDAGDVLALEVRDR